MRRRAQPNSDAAGVSLFPFLAVLLCTMGALIVVLVVIARQARTEADREIPVADAELKRELETKQADLEWRIEQMSEARKATLAQLESQREEVSHLEDHARRLRSQLEELENARREFGKLAAGNNLEADRLRRKTAEAESLLARKKEELAEALRNAAKPGGAYAVVPYHGPNETRRRPIYIECRGDSVVFQPEGLVLTEKDFEGDLGPGNPLASALRAAREHLRRTQLPGEGAPYPLLLIRPDGILAYEYVLAAMSSWGAEYGYELVGQDWPLEFPPPDPQLTLAMRQAIGEGRLRQAYLARAAPRLAQSGQHATFRASPTGGLMRDDGLPLEGTPRLSEKSRSIGRASRGRAGFGGGGAMASNSSTGSIASPGNSSTSQKSGGNPYRAALASQGIGGAGRSGLSARGGGAAAGSQGDSMLGLAAHGAGDYGFGGNGHDGQSVSATGAGASGRTGDSLLGGAGGLGGDSARNGDSLLEGTSRGSAGPSANLLASKSSASPQLGDRYGRGAGGARMGGARSNANGRGGSGAAPGLSGGSGSGRGWGMAQGQLGTVSRSTGIASGSGGRNASAAGTGSGTGVGSPVTLPSVSSGSAQSQGGSIQGKTQLTAAKGGPGGPGSAAVGSDRYAASPRGPAPQAASAESAESTGPMLADAASGAVDDGAGGNGNASTGSAIPGPGSENTSGSKQGSAAAAGSGSKTAGDSSAGKGATGGKTGGASGGAVAGTSGSGTSGGGQPGGGPGQPQPGAAGIPGLPNLTLGQQPQSIAEKRGERNWANPAANHSSFPVTRPIKVVCDADHLTMLPEGRSRRGYKVIEFDKSSEESVRELVESVWQRVDTWGAAGQGMYWRPELLMEIEPGGEKRFAELKALLADSGLDVRGRARQSPSIRYPRTRTPN